MKYNDLKLNKKMSSNNLANLFNVYSSERSPANYKIFNINRTFNIIGLDNISPKYFTTYLVKEGDTWSLISYKNYSTIELWWLVCKMNNIYDSTKNPEPGKTLKILAKSYLSSVLQALKIS